MDGNEQLSKGLRDIKNALNEFSIFAIIDAQGVIIYVNNKFCEISKYSREEILGKSHQAILSETHAKLFSRDIWKIISKGENWHGELCYRAKDGSIYWVSTTIIPFLDETRKSFQYVEISQNITERKKIEEELRESEDKLNGILNSLPAHIAVLDKNATIINVNKSWTDFTLANGGKKHLAKTNVKTNYLDVCYKSVEAPEALAAAKGIEDVISGKKTTFTLEYPCHSHTEERWFLLSVTPFLLNQGVVITHTDITKRKKAEEKLNRSRENLRLAIEAAQMYSWELDLNAWETSFGENFSRILGLKIQIKKIDAEESYRKLIHPNDVETVRNYIKRATDGKGIYSQEVRLVNPENGEVFWIEASCYAIHDDEGKPIRLVGVSRNITERKFTEHNLRESEERMRLVLSATKTGIWIHDFKTDRTYWSPETCEIFGVKEFDGTSETFRRFLHPENMDSVLENFNLAVKKGGQFKTEFKIIRPDGETRWIESAGHCEFDQNGKPLRFLGTNVDITNRKNTEMALRASEERYRLLFDMNPLPVWIMDAEDAKILAVNEAAIRKYGYSREEFLQMTAKELRPPEEIPKFLESLKKLRNTDVAISMPFKHRKKNGEVFDVEISRYKFIFEGQPAIFVIPQDVSERNHLAEAASQEQREKIAILESITDAFASLDRNFCYKYVNSAAEKSLQKSASELIGKCIWDVFPEATETKAFEEYHRALETGNSSIFDLYYEPFQNWLEIRVYPNASGLSVYWRDITERRQLEAKLARAAQLSLIGELAAGLAHEIKNPLAGIKGVIDILLQRRSAEADGGNEREILENVRHEIERIDKTVRELLQQSRPKSLNIKPSSLVDTVNRAARFAYHQTGIRHLNSIKIPTELDLPETPLIIPHDAAGIEGAVLNLIINARDAIGDKPDGKINLCLKTVKSENEDRNEAIIEVSDNGCGIPPEKLDRLFTPFYTTKADGTGLGLASVKRIIRAHGGECKARSILGKGTTFTISLPFSEAENKDF